MGRVPEPVNSRADYSMKPSDGGGSSESKKLGIYDNLSISNSENFLKNRRSSSLTPPENFLNFYGIRDKPDSIQVNLGVVSNPEDQQQQQDQQQQHRQQYHQPKQQQQHVVVPVVNNQKLVEVPVATLRQPIERVIEPYYVFASKDDNKM